MSRKRKADQQSGGPEMTELKQSCLADKRTASLSSSSTSSKSTIVLSPDVAIPETVHTSVLSRSDLEQTAGHRHAALHWNSLATSDLKKNLEADDAVKLSGKESEQREGEEARTAVTAGSRIVAPSTPTVANCKQFHVRLCRRTAALWIMTEQLTTATEDRMASGTTAAATWAEDDAALLVAERPS